MTRISKPIPTDRRRRRWRNPDPTFQSCYPDTVRDKFFRSEFLADDANTLNAQVDHHSESLPDAPDDNHPEPPPNSEKPQPLEHTHEESCPKHIHRDPDGPETPRESRSGNALHRKSKVPHTPSLPLYSSFAHATSRTMARSPSPEEPREPGGRYPSGSRASALQAQILRERTDNLKERTEVGRYIHSLIEDVEEYKRRNEHLNSELTQRDVQIRAFKHTISKVRPGNAAMTTDSQISNDYTYLVGQLKNWMRHFRGCKPTHVGQTLSDFGITDATIVSSTTKLLAENTPRRFLAVAMLVMWYLYEHVFAVFLFGADDREQRLLVSLSESFAKTATQREIHFWRSSTLKMIVATDGHKQRVRERKKELVAQIESLLVNTAPVGGNAGKRTESLKVVVDQAVALALTLRIQRARYYLYYLTPGKKFNEAYMEMAQDDADDDSEDGSGGEGTGTKIMGFLTGKGQKKVVVTVFPALIKSGNEDGDKYDENLWVCKAKVFGS